MIPSPESTENKIPDPESIDNRIPNLDTHGEDESASLKDCHCLVDDWWCHLLLPCRCKVSPL